MNLPLRRIFFKDCMFDILENVYEPDEDSFLLAENLAIKENSEVLDMGTGCGLLAILAAKKAKKVVATDVNPLATLCAAQNAVLNKVKNKVEVRTGNLFEPIKKEEKFDVILFNAPYLPSEKGEQDMLSLAWAGGKTGRKIIENFICEARNYLKKNGRILLVQSTLSNVEQSLGMFAKQGFAASVIAEKKVEFERIVVIEAKR